jgi:hypothetical protein
LSQFILILVVCLSSASRTSVTGTLVVRGAVAPESAIREVVLAGGFSEFRRATETPFNRIFEARK